jgi:hypothetical protein
VRESSHWWEREGRSPASGVDPLHVAAPVLEAVRDEPLVHVEPLGGGDVPLPLFLDLCGEPGLDDRSSPWSGSRGTGGGGGAPIIAQLQSPISSPERLSARRVRWEAQSWYEKRSPLPGGL